ncbi:MAG: serine/threonine protein kinase [Gemmataceae bacterium]|nr:serine/threonine protein kinase [Gemmataceae bacterium]
MAVRHENIASCYAVGEDAGLCYIAMEYVHASSLQQMVDANGPLQPFRAAHYIGQAAAGLQQIHSQGMIHRDIEPANIMVNRHGTVKIVDFGLALATHDLVLHGSVSLLTDLVLGPDYVAPELAANGEFDGRADIYSLGAVLYFCLAGRPPLDEGTVHQKLHWLETVRPQPIRSLRPDVPEAMAAIVEHMLAKDPPDRFATAQAVAEALRPWTQQPIAPPLDNELPRWSPAAMKVIGRSG